MRCPDRPERGRRSELASLRERLDALPANHPSSPRFTTDGVRADLPRAGGASGQDERPERDGRDTIAHALAVPT